MNNFQIDSFRAVLFDFDGTLADSYCAIAASVNHVRSQYDLPPLETEYVKRYVGRGMPYLLENSVPGGRPESDEHVYRAHHPTIMNENTELLPGAMESLAAIKRLGRSTGICSNKPSRFTNVLLQHLQLDGLIDAVFGPEDVGIAKPAPDMLIAAMKLLGIQPKQTLYIGDMIVDIETARSANVTVWVVPTGSETLAALQGAHPDRILENLHELAQEFENSVAG